MKTSFFAVFILTIYFLSSSVELKAMDKQECFPVRVSVDKKRCYFKPIELIEDIIEEEEEEALVEQPHESTQSVLAQKYRSPKRLNIYKDWSLELETINENDEELEEMSKNCLSKLDSEFDEIKFKNTSPRQDSACLLTPSPQSGSLTPTQQIMKETFFTVSNCLDKCIEIQKISLKGEVDYHYVERKKADVVDFGEIKQGDIFKFIIDGSYSLWEPEQILSSFAGKHNIIQIVPGTSPVGPIVVCAYTGKALKPNKNTSFWILNNLDISIECQCDHLKVVTIPGQTSSFNCESCAEVTFRINKLNRLYTFPKITLKSRASSLCFEEDADGKYLVKENGQVIYKV